MDLLRKDEANILIYGAHLVALEYYRELCRNGLKDKVIGFAVSDVSDNPLDIDGLAVKEIREYAGYIDDCRVVIAIPSKFHAEVEDGLRKLGFHQIEKVGLEELSVKKGDWLTSDYAKALLVELNRSENDPSWLDCCINLGSDTVKCKFPTLFYLEDSKLIEYSCNLLTAYKEDILGIRDLCSLNMHCDCDKEDEIHNLMRIYMVFDQSVFHVVDGMDYSTWIFPLLAGHRNKKGCIKFYSDDEWADSISEKNETLAEMTGAYWIWKQGHDSKYKGLCHYRRHFTIDENTIRFINSSNIDVLLTTPRFVPGGVRGMFEAETPVKKPVFENMLSAINDVAADDRIPFEDYLGKNFYFPNNMVIAKSEIYDGYCSWIFPILRQMMENDIETSYGHEKDRHIAYAAELLTSYYFTNRKNELNMAYTDYKFYG